VQRLLDLQLYPRLTELAGAVMSDEVLRSVAVAGTPADCAETIAELAAAGAGSIILVAGADDHEAHVERFARDVLPALRTR
jgi:5,10-methylenetetrahydromethanopterin reductase